ncbi:unnamed protein product [Haemonchus placei]|uniref:Non-specific serine/threonine protein kinase n=1 Tax=Haemonchus placei TaxID=6290 RepID=A0A0N4W9Z7_HAEPC|nr:unnamed protein product [Haemonchus placei]
MRTVLKIEKKLNLLFNDLVDEVLLEIHNACPFHLKIKDVWEHNYYRFILEKTPQLRPPSFRASSRHHVGAYADSLTIAQIRTRRRRWDGHVIGTARSFIITLDIEEIATTLTLSSVDHNVENRLE